MITFRDDHFLLSLRVNPDIVIHIKSGSTVLTEMLSLPQYPRPILSELTLETRAVLDREIRNYGLGDPLDHYLYGLILWHGIIRLLTNGSLCLILPITFPLPPHTNNDITLTASLLRYFSAPLIALHTICEGALGEVWSFLISFSNIWSYLLPEGISYDTTLCNIEVLDSYSRALINTHTSRLEQRIKSMDQRLSLLESQK